MLKRVLQKSFQVSRNPKCLSQKAFRCLKDIFQHRMPENKSQKTVFNVLKPEKRLPKRIFAHKNIFRKKGIKKTE